MEKTQMIELLDGKLAEQHEVIKALLACKSPSTGEPISENTQHTQLHVQRTAKKNLLLIKHLLEDKLDEADMKHFISLTTLSEERQSTRTVVKKGDNVMMLVMNNPKLNLEKIQKACDKAGLTIGTDGIIR